MANLYYKRIIAGIKTKVAGLWVNQVSRMLDESGYTYSVDDNGYFTLVK